MDTKSDKKDIYKEVFIVLSHFNKEIINRIPQKVFNKLIELAADSKREIFIDTNKSIEEQDITEESKDIISLIYYNCVADDNEKRELVTIWAENDKK